MWILFAFLSAFFAGLMVIFSKVGLKGISSLLLTAIRSIIVVIITFLMIPLFGSINDFRNINWTAFIYIALSGAVTTLGWLCYFRSLKGGNASKVAAVDKSSTIFTMILAIIFFGEPFGLVTIVSIVIMTVGTYLLMNKEEKKDSSSKKSWFVFALLSAVFAALTSIFAKMAMKHVDSYTVTFMRTAILLISSWILVFYRREHKEIRSLSKTCWIFNVLSGLATGLSWIFYYKALETGIVSIVVPIDRLSIIVTFLLSFIFLREKPNKKEAFGMVLIVYATLMLLI